MTPRESGHGRAYRRLLRLYPASFRTRYGDEMVQLFGDQLRDARDERASTGTAVTWIRTLGDLAVTAAAEHSRKDRTYAQSLTASPSPVNRMLGLLGIVGGAFLLAAFLPFPWDSPVVFNLRLVLFNVGAIAIVCAVHRRQASVGHRLALIGAVPAVLANAWYLAMIVLAVGRSGPMFAGDFGLVFFYAGAAMWLADAWFGLMTLRLGIVTRWGALTLAIGSVLAFTGMDRLELTSPDNPTIFGSLALAGIILNGLGWILLGLDVATRRRTLAVPRGDVAHGP